MSEKLKLKLTKLGELRQKLHLNPLALNERGFREQVDELFGLVYEVLETLAGDTPKGE